MGSCSPSSDKILSRGKVDLVYSTTSGTSRNIANKLQQILEDSKYLANIINVGDYDYEDLLDSDSTVIFLLSTYGDGASPSDGEKFYDWVTGNTQLGNRLSGLSYAILAFGNSSFENHCGFGVKTDKFLKAGGAKEMLEITLCDASSKEKDSDAKFPGWSSKLVEELNKTHQLQMMEKSNLGSAYQASTTVIADHDWQREAGRLQNLRKEFASYYGMYKAKVLEINELRKDEKCDRSTLHIRLQIDKSVEIWPACNVQVFPINAVQREPEDDVVVSYNEVRGKMPFPPMSLREIRKIVNFSQNASNKQIKTAILLAKASGDTISQYREKAKEKDPKVTCKKLVEDLIPKLQFLPELGLNNVRTYTLSSWDPQHRHLDLCVSLVKNGLTSTYFQARPQYIRIKTIPSTFYIPEQKRPIVMIANGSGIAPFRSIAQYVEAMPTQSRPYLRLYYGIQNANNDYYFEEDWRALEAKKIVDLRLAESRRDPSKKQYVQNVLEKDVEWLCDHLFKQNGVIFMCGGTGMAKDVDNVIFKALVLHVQVPYKAFSLSSQLKQKKVIVEEIFG